QEWDLTTCFVGQYDHVSTAIGPNGNLVTISNTIFGNNTDISLNCIHPNGNVNWSHSCSSSLTNDDYGVDLKVDSYGNIYLCAAKHNGNNYDYFIAKYNQSGSLIWQQSYNGTGNNDDVPSAIEIDANGDAYVTGT